MGAGLPVISTLRSLIETGDRIIKVEGILSGTLSYIFNTYRAGMKFSDVVADAKAKGYTEPDPREDLSGTELWPCVLKSPRLQHCESNSMCGHACL